MKNNFLSEMQSRGYLNQCTDLNKFQNTIIQIDGKHKDKNKTKPLKNTKD